MDNEKLRGEFEEWVRTELHKGNGRMAESALARKMFPDDESRYRQVWVDAAWTGWQASRAAIVLDLPAIEAWDCDGRLGREKESRADCNLGLIPAVDTVAALNAAGITVKEGV